MDEVKKSSVSNLVLNNETIYENTLTSPDSPSLNSASLANAAVVSQIKEDVAKLQQQQQQFNHLNSPANHVVSERVQNLAAQIYTELQKIIMSNNDDDDIVSGLMPLIVNVLESLDLQLIETQQLQVEIELMKDDNDRLVSAFDKEKQTKKKLEQQLFEYEFHSDEEKQKLTQKINSLESIVKMMELKTKNSNDTVSRLEDEKNELKSEFNNLHHRNNELLRSYLDLMERVKILIGSDDVTNLTNLNLSEIRKNVANVLDENLNDVTAGSRSQLDTLKPNQTINSNYNLNELMSMEGCDDNASLNDVSISLADEMKQDTSLVGGFVNTNDYASSNDNYGLNGMEKEVENLIKENNELLATKNALNIVKDDLIAQVDDLQSQLTLTQEENAQLVKIQNVLKQKVEKIEDELKKTLQQNEVLKQKLSKKNEDSEEGVPMAQRKRFTRNEMARVLMEKNQIKERLIDLQESIKWTDRVIKHNNDRFEEKRAAQSSIWKIGKNLSSFSSFFSGASSTMNSSSSTVADLTNVKYQNSNDEVNLDFDSSNKLTMTNIPALESMRRRVKQQQQKSNLQNESLMVFLDNDLYSEMKKMNKKASQLNSNNIVAYGWCLQKSDGDNVTTHPVPVPIHCRPLASSSQDQPNSAGLRIWCGAAVDLTGGEAGFPRSKSTMDTSIANRELSFQSNSSDLDLPAELRQLAPEYKLSTITWICSVSHSRSKITIVNMKSSPSEILDSFYVKTHLFCICSVPGTKNDDTMLDIAEKDLNGPLLFKRTFEKKQQTKIAKVDEDKNVSIDDQIASQDKLTNYLNYYKKSSTDEEASSAIEAKDTAQQQDDIHEKMSTVLPCMFLGGKNGRVYVHSSVAQWSDLIDYVDLSDSVLNINHYRGKVLVSLANGELCLFSRNQETGQWNLNEYIVANLNNCLNQSADLSPTNENESKTKKVYPIRCTTIAGNNIWCGYRNLVMVFRIDELKLLNVHAAHSSNEEQVRLLATVSYNDEADQFVICILRLDCVIRIYQNYAPFDCIYTIDLEPTINKFLVCNLSTQRGQKDQQTNAEQELNNKVGLINFIRLTSIRVTENRIWLGTANGVILTIPHQFDTEKNRPKLIIQDTQLSYHGHKEDVKFIIASKNFVLSAGEGYIDHRLEQESEPSLSSVLSKTDQNHLILWECSIP